MSLDVTQIAAQIGEMALKMKDGSQERREHLQCAVDKLCDKGINLTVLKHKIAGARTPWAVAGVYEALNNHYPAPSIPQEYTVLATDGSNIDVDRHKAARCYLINIGSVNLHYGQNPAAELASVPHLYSDEADLVIKNVNNKRREQQIEGALLDNLRAVEELAKLAAMAFEQPVDSGILALLDGSLVMYGLESFPDFVQSRLLDEGFLKSLDSLQKVSLRQPLGLTSYISLPRSADVVNALRVAICPQEAVDCDKSCSSGNSACDVISGLNDRLVFDDLLQPGERSALFINPSTILKHYGKHQVYFFYLKVDEEIARIEVPEWVALRSELLDLTHALILDQCRKGQGYPVALSEAHEKAVVSGADREEFWSLVDEALEGQKIPTYSSLKSRSKRTRWI